MLSLSELPLLEGEQGGQTGFQGWAKERSDLLATVESLKRLIAQMQTQRETQVRERGREKKILPSLLQSELVLILPLPADVRW